MSQPTVIKGFEYCIIHKMLEKGRIVDFGFSFITFSCSFGMKLAGTAWLRKDFSFNFTPTNAYMLTFKMAKKKKKNSFLLYLQALRSLRRYINFFVLFVTSRVDMSMKYLLT